MKPMYYLLAAALSIMLSIYIFIFGSWANSQIVAIFIGLWAPTIICLGIFNILMNIHDEMCCAHKRIEDRQTGHDRCGG
jgi:lipopolysaccharide export LptBFGC system permease protein LptF